MRRHLLAVASLAAFLCGGASHAQLSPGTVSTSRFYTPQTQSDPAACSLGNCPEQKYSYANATIRVGDTEHHWSCHNTTSGVVIDSIVYFERSVSTGLLTYGPTPVLGNLSGTNGSPSYTQEVGGPGQVVTASGWDGYHLCDPSVTRGAFKLNNTPYTYALFFLGTDAWSTHNQVGVAFANSPRGPWVKVPFAIVSYRASSAPSKNCRQRPAALDVTRDWGVGQPSATPVQGGEVLLFYTVGSASHVNGLYTYTEGRVAHVDLSNVWSGDPVSVVTHFDKPLPTAGLTGHDGLPDPVLNNFDVAYNPRTSPFYDPTEDRFYVAREQHGTPAGQSSIEVVSLSSVDVWGACDANQTPPGTWRHEATLDASVTGQSLNGQPAIERNEWGQFYSPSVPRFLYVSETYVRPETATWRDVFRYESWSTRGCLPGFPCGL
ncbi:hypothetical protein P2318_10480 [Myxococcaceae bacterium GXIMD 01537]